MQVQNNSHINKEHAVTSYQQKTENFAQRFRQQSQNNENDLKVIKSQYETVQQKYMVDLK
jgi:hypothetical protein